MRYQSTESDQGNLAFDFLELLCLAPFVVAVMIAMALTLPPI